jgi:hypothetical protein
MITATRIEMYQGDGENGPFGYIDGWFVNWYREAGDDRLLFWLEAEDGYQGDGPLDQTDAYDTVSAHVDRLENRERSHELESITSRLSEVA